MGRGDLKSLLKVGDPVGSGVGGKEGVGLVRDGEGEFNALLLGGVGSRVGRVVGTYTGSFVGRIVGIRGTGCVTISGKFIPGAV